MNADFVLFVPQAIAVGAKSAAKRVRHICCSGLETLIAGLSDIPNKEDDDG
jgi:hypothetical protein